MFADLTSALRPTLVMSLLFALLLGLAYPLALTGIGQAIFPYQANGSLVIDKGRVIGSALIGQAFAGERYLHGRPSAAGKGYDASASSGSNLGPTSQALVDRVKADVAAQQALHPGKPLPADLVTASASGLDPDISPAAAEWQVDRIAKARGIDAAIVRRAIASATTDPLLGDARVNVFAVNRRLERIAG